MTSPMGHEANRRQWFRMTAAGVAALTVRESVADDGPGVASELIIRGGEPLNAETPAGALTTWITPNRLFFVRSHFGPPAIGLRPWKLGVTGTAPTPLEFGLGDLAKLEQVTVPAVLQCSGNGRAKFSPTVPGVGWACGAVGNAEWTGVRLADLLKDAGLTDRVKHVHFLGADGPPNPKTPSFLRSLPIDRAMAPATLLALKMNGEPLPVLHGGPIRLVVPGWAGNHWMKWLRSIRLSSEEAPGFYQRTGYRMPRATTPPDATVKPEDTVPVTSLNVKSLIAGPVEGQRLKAGEAEIRGVAWTGGGRVAKVEVAIDGRPWTPAELHGPDHEGAWRLWRFSWKATPGRHVVRARAADTSGAVQPEKTAWNKSGYLWNGIESSNFEVTDA